MCGSMTVSGSSNRMALTSERTRPRPSEIFCFWSAVRPLARFVRPVGEADHLEHLAHPAVDIGLRHAAVAQREGQIVVDGHRVVDDRELEHLRDVALLRRQVGHVLAVEQQLAVRGMQQAGDDVEQRGLAAAGRSEQRIGAAVLEGVVHFLQRVVLRRLRVRRRRRGGCGCRSMRAICSLPTPPALRAARPSGRSASKTMMCRGSMKTSIVLVRLEDRGCRAPASPSAHRRSRDARSSPSR